MRTAILAAASIAALSQNANAAEFKSEHEHFNRSNICKQYLHLYLAIRFP
jgi:hypothetical protein